MWVLKEHRLSVWVSYIEGNYHNGFFLNSSENSPPRMPGDSWLRTGKDMSPWTLSYGFPRALRMAPKVLYHDESMDLRPIESGDW